MMLENESIMSLRRKPNNFETQTTASKSYFKLCKLEILLMLQQ
jgi:hypothetical protein